VSDKGGPNEMVLHGKTGMVTRARDASSMLASIEQLIEQPQLRHLMAQHCRVYAETRSWRQIYQDFWSESE
jgi:glycosyltransferase involved in cell wall biosynthesis